MKERRHLNRSKLTVLLAFILCFLLVTEATPLGLAESGNAPTRTPIKHLIILMMENHSFDNLFGVYGVLANGTRLSGAGNPLDLISHPTDSTLSSVSSGNFSTTNPYEGYANYHTDWNLGKMNGFLNGSGPNSLTYYTVSQVGLEWLMAKQYALADMYFSSTLSETLPNRLYSLTGFSPVRADQIAPPPYVTYNQTIFQEMDQKGITWAYYFNNPTGNLEPLQFIYGMGSHRANIQSWTDFANAVQKGRLPDVSWVSPIDGGANGYSQHPPNNILTGEVWLFYIIHLIMMSSYWSSTAILITYDEGGGYYDQVPPPVIDGSQLGFRVPFIVISPFAKEDYVSNTVMSHASILAFIDYNWEMPALNRLVSYSGLPLDMFNFNKTYPGGNLARPSLTFNSEELAYLSSNLTDSNSVAMSISNTSSVFEAPFQYPLSEIGYNLTGNSSLNLSQLSNTVYVTSDVSYSPILVPPTIGLAVLSAAGISSAVIVLIARRRKR